MPLNPAESVLKRREAQGLLGIGDDFSMDKLRRAYRTAALQFLPSRDPNDWKEAAERMARLNGAYEILLTPESTEEGLIKRFCAEGFII